MTKSKNYVNRLLVGCIILLGSFSIQNLNAQTWNPTSYWTFDRSNPLSDNMGTYTLDASYYQSVYSISNASQGSVGKSLKLSSGSRILVASTPFMPANGFTVEFLFKADPNINSIVQFFSRRDGGMNLRFGYTTFRFSTKSIATGSTSATTDNFDIPLNGIGRGSYGYYVDGNWHHLVFVYNATTGTKQVWVDGQLPTGFSKSISPGTIPSSSNNINEFICDLNTNTSYYKVTGNMDEIALYNTALPGNMVYKHYMEFQAGAPYTFGNSTTTPPVAAPITGSININEYAPGHPSPTVNAYTQLINFAAPRYKKGHTLYSNIQVFSPAYLTGYLPGQQVTAAHLQSSKNFQLELARNYNYAIQVSNNTHNYNSFGDTNRFDGAWIQLANSNPQFRASANSYWTQLTPTTAGFSSTDNYVQCGCLPNSSYLRNSSGQFINESGAVSSVKRFSPEAPIDSIRQDGRTQRFFLQQLTNKMTRNLDVIFENGEILPWYKSSGLALDPTVNAAKNAMGVDWNTYIGRNFNRINQVYKNELMALPALSNTKFTYFQISGHPDYNWKYSETRTMNSPMNGQVYSSGDLYPVKPENWRFWSGAWKGWQFLVDSRYNEIQAGDNLFSPTVSPGWSNDEAINIRPAQWLGFLKAVSMTGAEYFHTAYFVLKSPYQNPANYIWQMVVPAYAQGITSRYEDLMRNGKLMDGDYPNDPINKTTQPGYSFYAGDLRKLIVARKHNTLSRYAITGTIQPNSNQAGNAELESTATIKLDGQNLTFNIRRQGSTYIYDRTNAAAPVFYQLDAWHENSHPSFWSNNFNLEGELFDNNNTNLSIITRVPQGTAAGDYRVFTSSVAFRAATNADYYFTQRGNIATTQYVWVRARSTDGTATGFNVVLDNASSRTVSCVQDTNWLWYRINANTGNPLVFTAVSPGEHLVSIVSTNGKLEIDQILITPNSGAVYSTGVANPCNVTATALITPSSSTTFCSGGSVVLTANQGTSYLWSTGATTRAITATTAGSYVVTVTTNGVSAVSPAVSVSLAANPTATITASGSTSLCAGNSVTLTAALATSYLWSTGATTRAITTSTPGNYSVTITNASGCSAASPATTVTTASGNAAATISVAGGNTTICSGRTTTLTSSTASSYLWSTGATTASITVSTAGTYTVTTNPTSGCPSVSSPVTINVQAAPSPVFSASGPLSFCNGGRVTISSSTNPGWVYLWFRNNVALNNNTTPSYTATTAGTYKVRVSQNGCSQYSPSYTVSIPCREGEESGTGNLEATVYPNPASDQTTIAFNLPNEEMVTIELLDLQGKLIEHILPSATLTEGEHQVNYNTSDLAKGIYLVRIASQQHSRIIRLVCIR
jgi:hypothetical protein